MQEFISSLNIYGTTPFLYPIYGGGDVLQSFCRINNVYAGITMLQTQVLRVLSRKEDQQILALEVANESLHTVIRCKHVIASDDYAFAEEKNGIQHECTHLVHGIYIFRGNNRGTPQSSTTPSTTTTTSTTTSTTSTTSTSLDNTSRMYGQSTPTGKDLREIIVIPAATTQRAIYLIVVGIQVELTSGRIIDD